MVFFVVGDNEYEYESSLTLLNVKQHLIKELNLSCKYIDLEFCLERPMRVLGKFNVEPGKVPRPLDKNTLSEFAFKDKVKLSYTDEVSYAPPPHLGTHTKEILKEWGGYDEGRIQNLIDNDIVQSVD